jgi:hypothetical protein
MANDNKQNPVDGVRTKVRELYWKAVASPLGRYIPTPQVLGAALAAVAANIVATQVPSLSLPAGLLETVAALVVGYVIGPPINPADVGPTLPEGSWLLIPDEEVVEQFDAPPEVPGEWVGPEDDPNPPGQIT